MNKNNLQIAFRVSSLIAGSMLFLFIFRDVNISATFELISQVGYLFAIILSLYLIGSIFDTIAWKSLLESSSTTISFLRLLLITIAGESFYRFLPAGVIVGESVKVILVRKHFSFSYSEIVSSLLMRKLLMGFAQALYIGLAIFIGVTLNSHHSNVNLTRIGMIISGSLFILFITVGYLFYKGNLGVTLYSFLVKIPISFIQNNIIHHREIFTSTDKNIQESIINQPGKSIIALSFFFFGWLSELTETYIILVALSASASFAASLVFEPIVSFLRSVVFFIPAGLGVMDYGYSASLQFTEVGTVGTVAAAFIIIKRAKELFWILIGVVLTIVFSEKDYHSAVQLNLAALVDPIAKH